MKLVNGFYYPDYDTQAAPAAFSELYKISKVLEYCNNTRAVIQAGANVGVFPMELSKTFEHVYTFEPDEENYECLVKNVQHVPNIYIYKEGLSNKATKGNMYQPDRADNCGSLTVQEGVGDIILTTIDFKAICDPIDLIYLDIEGAEYKALLGAKDTIAKYKPVIVVENKGHIPEFPNTGLNGSQEFRDWLCNEFNYMHVTRLMRDDVFIPV